MTQGQILTWTIIARCYYAKHVAWVATLSVIGDPTFKKERIKVLLVRSIIKRIKYYNPDSPDNCLTFDEIFRMMNACADILGMCGDPYSLEESDTSCINPVFGLTLLNP